MSNYPAGVSDSHPYFNPPREIASAVECGADEALVIPSFVIKADLIRLRELTGHAANMAEVDDLLAAMQYKIGELEQEREYECPFNDDIDLEESECARWDCPVCGNERETDTMPEERDPDYEWDHRGEGR
jgi:hypothetical protein